MINPSTTFHDIYPLQKPATAEVHWTVRPDLPYFNGHFPNTPILPAIAIIEASTHLLQRALENPQLKAKAVLNAKFMSPILPEQKLKITWKSLADDEWQLDWSDETTEKLLATLSIQL